MFSCNRNTNENGTENFERNMIALCQLKSPCFKSSVLKTMQYTLKHWKPHKELGKDIHREQLQRISGENFHGNRYYTDIQRFSVTKRKLVCFIKIVRIMFLLISAD